MENVKTYENYPLGIVFLSNLVSIGIYLLGFLIILHTGWIFAILYLAYILAFEIRLVRNHCTHCYYWGKTCAFGRGGVSSLLFKKSDPSKFCEKAMTWKDLIPDLLISLFPLVTGIVLLILDFNIVLLLALLVLLFLTTSGNGLVRGSFACKFCKQRELGCPAMALFNRGKQD